MKAGHAAASGPWCTQGTAEKTWEFQKTGIDYTLSSIHFPDGKNGWAVGDEGMIIHTTDGGKTWMTQKSPVSYFLMGVFFVNDREGWIVTERTTILHTNDGGGTWKVQFKDTDFILKAVSFADELNGWVVGEYGYIYHTRDGGNSWEKQAGKFGISMETGEIEAGYFIFDVAAVDPDTAWGVGIDGHVVKTTDGGNTWNQVDVPIPKVHLFSVAVSTSGIISICGDGVFLWSDAGAGAWHKATFSPPIKYSWLYGLTTRGRKDFVTVGADGAIYINDQDGAASWSSARY